MLIILIIQIALSEKKKADLVSQSSNLNELVKTFLVTELRGVIFFFQSPIPWKVIKSFNNHLSPKLLIDGLLNAPQVTEPCQQT